jgi:gas vesicle protein
LEVDPMRTRDAMALAGAACVSAALLFVGCEEKSNPNANSVGNAVNNAANATSDAVKNAAAATKDAARNTANAVKEGASDFKNWVSDTVDRQWPAMKTEVDQMGDRIASIKDTNVKAKAETMWSDLKAQMPKVEEAVTKAKNATADQASALMADARAAWDSFVAKLEEMRRTLAAG